jgi:hypothetical protein
MLYTPGTTSDYSSVRFQNNIQSIFSRVRLLYGSTPIEDIIGYNVIVRALTEWTGTCQTGTMDQTSINEGIGGYVLGVSSPLINNTTENVGETSMIHTRKGLIHGIDLCDPPVATAGDLFTAGIDGTGSVPNGSGAVVTIPNHNLIFKLNPVRRYQVQLALGLFNQEKLIPTKFMASQLAIEITLATAAECMIYDQYAVGAVSDPSYSVSNVNLIPEILEFDASYDETFIRGLMEGGVPLKFATWNNYRFSAGSSSAVNLQIQERSRSVKAIFCMQRRDPATITTDSGAMFFNSNITGTGNTPSSFNEYQFRIGGRYFPAQPVQNSTVIGGGITNGGAESWIELQKALNILGDYRLSSSCNTIRWGCGPGAYTLRTSTVGIPDLTTNTLETHNEYDYQFSLGGYTNGGAPVFVRCMYGGVAPSSSSQAGNLGSACFAMAIDLETSSGAEISGLNAEEQSDISLIARYSAPQAAGFIFDVYTYIDSMIVLKENNVLELIQ